MASIEDAVPPRHKYLHSSPARRPDGPASFGAAQANRLRGLGDRSYELYTGVEKCKDPHQERQKVDHLLRTVNELDFTLEHARSAGAVRAKLESLGTPIGPYDILLAGQAIAAGLTLITANVAEFKRVDGLSLLNWQA